MLRTVANHPVHIVDEKGGLSPSAFIPFCSFGGDMKSLGTNHEDFPIPVCDKFRAKVKNNQVCYELDLEQLKNEENIEDQLKTGLVLILDYNEDRQLKKTNELYSKVTENLFIQDDEIVAKIYLDTISLWWSIKEFNI